MELAPKPQSEMLNFSNLGMTPFIMGLNLFCAVSIIFVNKIVFKMYEWSFATVLTGCHFIVTYLGLVICAKMGIFQVKSVAIKEVIPLCLAFCGFVVFNNLSLQENSVGFYQLMKIMTTPVVALIQYQFYGVPLPTKLAICLVPVIVGVIMVSVSEIGLTALGLTYAVCGILSTSFYQIWVKTRQQDLNLNSFQLLYYQAPISAVFVLTASPLFDNIFPPLLMVSGKSVSPVTIFEYEYESKMLMFAFGSCLLAFGVNLSIFLTIGRTSPISYNVLGHFKLVAITTGGIFMFQEETNTTKNLGILTALVGIISYTHFKLQMKNEWDERAKQTQVQQAPRDVEDPRPLLEMARGNSPRGSNP